MFFDDRLATVLRQEGSSDSAKRTQFRQLLDILGNRKFGPAGRSDPSLVAAAWLRMDSLGRSLPAKERASMIREASWRFRSADLAAHLADFEPEVASAALNRAELSEEDWCALIPRLPVRARGFLRLRKDLPPDALAILDRLGVSDRGLPLPMGSPAEAQIIEEPEEPADEAALEPEPLDLDSEVALEDALIEDAAPLSTDAGGAESDENEGDEPLWPSSPPAPANDEPDARNDAPINLAPMDAPQSPPSPDPVETGRSEISALVERIARFKRSREETDADALIDSERSPRLPLGEIEPAPFKRVASFGFVADASGRIDWADAEVAAMVIGRRLVAPRPLGEPAADSALERAILQRQPIVDARTELIGAPAIEGEWSLDASPRFTLEGHFSGYVGRYRRVLDEEDGADDAASEEADRIRQLLHELRTPVTAIQGYSEVIQQQLFAPVPHEYRALAAAIAADSAYVLAGFEELDRLARLEIGALALEGGESDLSALARQTERQLEPVLAQRESRLRLDPGANSAADADAHSPLVVAMDHAELELLVWRVMATLGGACQPGETITAQLNDRGERAALVCDLPSVLRGEEDIFAADVKPAETVVNAGVFGAGFALRLARAESRAIGGDLVRKDDALELTLPLLEQPRDVASLTGV